MSLMMEAASDPTIMRAMQTAMAGSPADLLRAGREDPEVADFLRRLWGALGDVGGGGGAAPTFPVNGNANGAAEAESYAGPETNAFEDVTTGLMDKFRALGGPPSPSSYSPPIDVDVDVVVEVEVDAPSNNYDDDVSAPHLSTSSDEEAYAYTEMSDVVKEELESTMRPELLNRIDEIVVFRPLAGDDLSAVAQILLDETSKRAMEERDVEVRASSRLLDVIVEEGGRDAGRYGARPMRRAVGRFFEDTVGDAIIRGFLKEGDGATVDLSTATTGEGGGGDNLRVSIVRTSDGEAMTVEVEDGNGGIGSGGGRGRGEGEDDGVGARREEGRRRIPETETIRN